MPHKVVRPFAYAADGIHAVELVAGDERDFGSCTAGLLKEGYIEEIAAPAKQEPELSQEADDVEATATLVTKSIRRRRV